MTTPHVTIYTDGGAKPNPNGPGGWAALLLYEADDGQTAEKALSGGAPSTTNNRMELTAACEALEALKVPCAVTFYTDSQYVRNGITSWLHNWVKNGWRTASKKTRPQPGFMAAAAHGCPAPHHHLEMGTRPCRKPL